MYLTWCQVIYEFSSFHSHASSKAISRGRLTDTEMKAQRGEVTHPTLHSSYVADPKPKGFLLLLFFLYSKDIALNCPIIWPPCGPTFTKQRRNNLFVLDLSEVSWMSPSPIPVFRQRRCCAHWTAGAMETHNA